MDSFDGWWGGARLKTLDGGGDDVGGVTSSALELELE